MSKIKLKVRHNESVKSLLKRTRSRLDQQSREHFEFELFNSSDGRSEEEKILNVIKQFVDLEYETLH